MIELNDVDGPLQDIKYMAEVAAELADKLARGGAQVLLQRYPAAH
jgi:hypothetical protein